MTISNVTKHDLSKDLKQKYGLTIPIVVAIAMGKESKTIDYHGIFNDNKTMTPENEDLKYNIINSILSVIERKKPEYVMVDLDDGIAEHLTRHLLSGTCANILYVRDLVDGVYTKASVCNVLTNDVRTLENLN